MLEALFVNSLLAQGASFLKVTERTADFYTFDLSESKMTDLNQIPTESKRLKAWVLCSAADGGYKWLLYHQEVVFLCFVQMQLIEQLPWVLCHWT